jgi:electron transport complex protein RnfD
VPKMFVSSAPQIKNTETVSSVMRDVIIALIPAIIASIYFFGVKAIFVETVCIIGAVLTEWAWCKITGKKNTIYDLSAVVTGLLLAMVIPPQIPWWAALIGSFVAIFVAKELFGGLGNNIFNPALIGRAFLLSSWPVYMTTWAKPEKLFSHSWLSISDGVTGATPLALANV